VNLGWNPFQVFREGRTKAVGNITKLIPMTFSTGGGPKVKAIKNAPKNSNAGGQGSSSSASALGQNQNNENLPLSLSSSAQVQNPPGTNPKRHRGKRGGRGRSNGSLHNNPEDGISIIPEGEGPGPLAEVKVNLSEPERSLNHK
jgi:hypothetical protein